MGKYLNRIHTALPAPYCCTRCGRELYWSGDFMRNEIEGLDYDEVDDDDNSVVGMWACVCGEEYEITSYSNNELKIADEMAETFGEQRSERGGNVTDDSLELKPLAKDSFVKAVLEAFCIDFDTLVGGRRVRNYVMAREVVAHYLFTEKGCSVARVGELIGNRAPATAFHLIKLYETDFQYDRQFKKLLKDVERILGHEDKEAVNNQA